MFQVHDLSPEPEIDDQPVEVPQWPTDERARRGLEVAAGTRAEVPHDT